MKKLVFKLSISFISIVIAVIIINYAYDMYKNKIYFDEKHMLDAAIISNDVGRLNQFIIEYPVSKWGPQAIYYRDKITLNEAIDSNNIIAINLFLKQYPTSDWYRTGVYHRDKLAYTQAKKINTIASYTDYLENHAGSDWQEHAEYQLKHLNTILQKEKSMNAAHNKSVKMRQSNASQVDTVKVESLPKIANVTKPKPPLTTAERLNKAVAIYDTMREDKERRAKIKRKNIENAKAKKYKCNVLKDSINRYDEHIAWYDIDDNGDRRYATKQEVENRKQKDIDNYQRICVK